MSENYWLGETEVEKKRKSNILMERYCKGRCGNGKDQLAKMEDLWKKGN